MWSLYFFHFHTTAFPHSYHFKIFMLSLDTTTDKKSTWKQSTTYSTDDKAQSKAAAQATVHTFQRVLEYEREMLKA